jgi:flagellar basal-body rod modification protein FlgD
LIDELPPKKDEPFSKGLISSKEQIMSAIGSGINSTVPSRSQDIASAFANVDTDQFLQLMITELQNQDPMDPTDSSEFLQQITQIREIGASDKMTETLDRVLAGQNLAMASGLIGKEVVGMDSQLNEVRGVVERVAMVTDRATDSQSLQVYVDGKSFAIDRVREISG